MFERILFEKDGPVATLSVNRPEVRNAADNATVEAIDAALALVEADPGLRVLIVTGTGDKPFVAGADVKELVARDAVTGRLHTRRRQQVLDRLEQLRSPAGGLFVRAHLSNWGSVDTAPVTATEAGVEVVESEASA